MGGAKEGIDGQLAGSIEVADTLKGDARNAVRKLRNMGIFTAMLTGDRPDTANAVAEAVGIEAVHARLLPEEKLAALQSIRKEKGAVLFVGDGINDAPVLAGADVGAAMGNGADAAIEAADVVFLTSQTAAVPRAVEIARQTKTIAMQNIVFALAVKAVILLLGAMGMANMWIAVFGDVGVLVIAIMNAMRAMFIK